MKTLTALFLGAALASHAVAGATDTIERRQALAPDAEVTIENVNGSITVSSWDRPEIELVATRHAKHEADLQKIVVKLEASERKAKISTDLPTFNNSNLSADYVIHVPSGVKLKKVSDVNGAVEITGVSGAVVVETVNGHIELKDLGGAIEANSVNGGVHVSNAVSSVQTETVNGGIKVTLARLNAGTGIRAKTVNGGVSISLPKDASAKLAASSQNGGVSNDYGLPNPRKSFGGVSFEGTVGGGGADVRVESVNGSVEFKKS